MRHINWMKVQHNFNSILSTSTHLYSEEIIQQFFAQQSSPINKKKKKVKETSPFCLNFFKYLPKLGEINRKNKKYYV